MVCLCWALRLVRCLGLLFMWQSFECDTEAICYFPANVYSADENCFGDAKWNTCSGSEETKEMLEQNLWDSFHYKSNVTLQNGYVRIRAFNLLRWFSVCDSPPGISVLSFLLLRCSTSLMCSLDLTTASRRPDKAPGQQSPVQQSPVMALVPEDPLRSRVLLAIKRGEGH